MKNYISQLHGKEQNAVHCIKKLIASQMQALIIYGFGFETVTTVRQTAFRKKQAKEKRQFSCDLLIITPDAVTIDDEKKVEVQEIISHFAQVNMTIHPISFALQQLNKGNLFFNWVHKNGMLLFDRNNTAALLPPAIGSEYWPQVEVFYENDPSMVNYLDVNLQPLAKSVPEKQEKKPPSQPPVEIRVMFSTPPGTMPIAVS